MIKRLIGPALVDWYYRIVNPIYRDLWGDHLHGGWFDSVTDDLKTAQDRMIENVLGRIPETSNYDEYLEIGCGNGLSAIALAKMRTNCEITAISISQGQIDRAIRLAEQSKLTNRVNFFREDAHLIEANRDYDAVYSLEALFHMDHPEVISRAQRALRTGGTFVFTDIIKRQMNPVEDLIFTAMGAIHQYADNTEDCRNLYRLLQNSGFVDISIEDISQYVAPTMAETMKIFRERRSMLVRHHGWFAVKLMEVSWGMLTKFYDRGVGYILVTAKKR
jgi:cyclopropane fatty-acyl-phospholipid synthase-like methyltransferase